MKRQMHQLINAKKDRIRQEAQDVADIYHKLDKDRKDAYNMRVGNPKKSSQNLAYKYVEHKSGFGESPAVIERFLRSSPDNWNW